jgi:hypothetical protein
VRKKSVLPGGRKPAPRSEVGEEDLWLCSQDRDLVAQPADSFCEDRFPFELRQLAQQRPVVGFVDDREREGFPVGDLGPSAREGDVELASPPLGVKIG